MANTQPNQATRQHQTLEAVTADSLASARKLLAVPNRWLTPDELARVYAVIFPAKIRSKWDNLLNEGRDMPKEAVRDELGPDMLEPYEHLVSSYKFQSVGKRQHAKDPALLRHLWNCAWRAELMGLPLETKLATLMHELPEHKARGVDEAYKIIHHIKSDATFGKLGPTLADVLDSITDYDAIAVDHTGHCLHRNGTAGGREALEAIARSVSQSKEALKEKKSKAYVFYDNVWAAVNKLKTTMGSMEKRVIPPALSGEQHSLNSLDAEVVYGYICDELKACLNPVYVARIFKVAREMLENGSQNAYMLPAIRALSHMDKLRTMDSRREVEKATREAMTFAEKFGSLIKVLECSDIFDNRLYFLNAALQTELHKELGIQAELLEGRPDTAFAETARLTRLRNETARKLYSDHAIKQ